MIKEIIKKLKAYIESENDKIWYQRRYIQIVAGIIVLLLATIGIVTSAHKNNATVEEIAVEDHAPVASEVQDGNAAIAPDEIEVVSTARNNENMVTVSVEDTGRADPFLPVGENASLSAVSLPYYMAPPPESTGYDEDAVKVVKTKVSGIMYDKYNPSAILNIDDADYLVRAGDTINGYEILKITPTMVAVRLGANTYRAGVGEMFSGEDMNYVNDSFGRTRQ